MNHTSSFEFLHDQFRNPVIPKSVGSNPELYQLAEARDSQMVEITPDVLKLTLLIRIKARELQVAPILDPCSEACALLRLHRTSRVNNGRAVRLQIVTWHFHCLYVSSCGNRKPAAIFVRAQLRLLGRLLFEGGNRNNERIGSAPAVPSVCDNRFAQFCGCLRRRNIQRPAGHSDASVAPTQNPLVAQYTPDHGSRMSRTGDGRVWT